MSAGIAPGVGGKMTSWAGNSYDKKGMQIMTNQQKMEIIKALAYGETPEQAAKAEGLTLADVQAVQQSCAGDIAEERAMLKKVGYIHG